MLPRVQHLCSIVTPPHITECDNSDPFTLSMQNQRITMRLREIIMDGWMDGWVDGWMDRWMDGWMDRWMDGWDDACFKGHELID